MALDVNSPINPLDINEIQLVKDGKIIVLHGHGKDKLVLKQEKDASVAQVKGAKTVMSAVDPALSTKVVTKAEAELLITFIDDLLEVEGAAEELNGAIANPEYKEIMGLKKAVQKWLTDMESGKNPLLKMAYVNVFDIRDVLERRLGTGPDNKAGIQAFIAGLNGEGGFEKLGSVLAADMLNDNHDRFCVWGGTSPTIGGRQFRFKALTNAGNVFLEVTENGGKSLSGLDFVPPVLDGADINLPLKEKHPARILADKTKRAEFAAKVISDLEMIVHPKRGKLSRNKLPGDAAKRLIAGMIVGAKSIAAALKKKAAKQNPVSAGIAERLALLETVK